MYIRIKVTDQVLCAFMYCLPSIYIKVTTETKGYKDAVFYKLVSGQKLI
jgi:hypothetical protein